MQITTRSVAPEDSGFLLSLFLSSHPELEQLPVDGEAREAIGRLQFTMQTSDYQQRFGSEGHKIILADDNRVGRIWLFSSKLEIVIVDLALTPGYRGLGVGTQVLRQVISDAYQQNRELSLTVRIGNPAIRLYQRLGFEIVSTDELLVQMTCRIPPR